jgi:transcriptional regulator with XRE-family HTH domain
MSPLAIEVGKALRRARRARGLTLRQVTSATEGRLRPSSVAGYERGERAISLERFYDLCQLYGVAPQALLADVIRALEGKPEPIIDLTLLDSLGSAESTLVSGFIRQIRALRREQPSERIVLRMADLEVLANAAGKKPEELIELLGPSIQRDPEDPAQIDPEDPAQADAGDLAQIPRR